MKDILLDGGYDLRVAGGDLVIGESTYQHQQCLLLAEKNSYKQYPLIGVGIVTYLKDEDNGELLRDIRFEFTRDGMDVQRLSASGGSIQAVAGYRTQVSTGAVVPDQNVSARVLIPVNTVTVRSGQTLLDLAVQELGSAAGLFEIADLNVMTISDMLADGQLLKIPSLIDSQIRKAYQDGSWYPASDVTEQGAITPEDLIGIDYWAIGVDFIVS